MDKKVEKNFDLVGPLLNYIAKIVVEEIARELDVDVTNIEMKISGFTDSKNDEKTNG